MPVKSPRSDHHFPGFEYRNTHLKHISVKFSRAKWQLIRPCPHLRVSACLLRNTDTCLRCRQALSRSRADGRSPLVLVIWCFCSDCWSFPLRLRAYVCASHTLTRTEVVFRPLAGRNDDSSHHANKESTHKTESQTGYFLNLNCLKYIESKWSRA